MSENSNLLYKQAREIQTLKCKLSKIAELADHATRNLDDGTYSSLCSAYNAVLKISELSK